MDELRAMVSGAVLVKGDQGYDEQVASFNTSVTHTPDVVVVATGPADVSASLRWASARGLPVGVQATGHGASVAVDRGLLVSTRALATVQVDPRARTAVVGAGAKWAQVVEAAAPHGLAGLSGSSSDVGVVGYTLGGGLPMLGRAFGYAADLVRSFEVVTGDGAVHQVDAAHEPELFWALRGGKGNVGIVTSMVIDLVPVDTLYGGSVIYEGRHAAVVFEAYRQWVKTLPDAVCTSLVVLRLPPFPDIPEPLRGQCVVALRIASLNDPDESDRILAPMRAVAPALIDSVAPMSYRELDRIHEDPDHPVPAHEGNTLIRELSTEAVETLLAFAGPAASCPLIMVELRHLGGALARPPEVEDAIAARDAEFALICIGMMMPELAPLVPGALTGLLDAMAPYSTGCSMVNLHGTPRDEEDRARPWTAEAYARLKRDKAVYDPENLLRFGHAVTPALVGAELSGRRPVIAG